MKRVWMVPESGKVPRIREGGSEVVLDGLSLPSALSFNARGDAFVALNIFGPPGSGEVVRFPRLTAQPGEARVGVQALPALGNLASLAWSLGVR